MALFPALQRGDAPLTRVSVLYNHIKMAGFCIQNDPCSIYLAFPRSCGFPKFGADPRPGGPQNHHLPDLRERFYGGDELAPPRVRVSNALHSSQLQDWLTVLS